MKNIVLASNNKHKIIEIKEMLEPLGFNVLSLFDIGFNDEIIENGSTFKENSMIKALAVKNRTSYPVIADDSGLSVDCLDGAPGVHSHRFASEFATDKENRDKLISILKEKNLSHYPAHFVTAMTYINGDKVITKEGYVYGEIILDERGTHGFGYDPIFYLKDRNKTMSELTDSEKNEISHRHNALIKLIEAIKE